MASQISLGRYHFKGTLYDLGHATMTVWTADVVGCHNLILFEGSNIVIRRGAIMEVKDKWSDRD